jgi:ligand-binding sensor domain-containing protein
MAFLSTRIGLVFTAMLLCLNLLVPNTKAQTDRDGLVAQRETDQDVYSPTYVDEPPPPLNEPLPSEGLRQDTQRLSPDFRVSALQPDFTGDLWIGSWLGLSRINPNTGKVLARIRLPNYTVGALAQDRVGRIWVGTYEGLLRVDPRSNEVTAQNFTLPSNRVCRC